MNTAAKSTKNTNSIINLKIYISAAYSDYDKKFHFFADSYDSTKYSKERVHIGTQDIEVVVPSHDTMLPKYVSGLKEVQTDIRAEMQAKIEKVQERINNVLALEYVPLDNIPN